MPAKTRAQKKQEEATDDDIFGNLFDTEFGAEEDDPFQVSDEV